MAFSGVTQASARRPDDIPYAFGARAPHPRQLDLDQLRSQVEVKQHQLTRRQYLYRAGQPFRSLFMIHAGSAKTCELSGDGREHISGFAMSGDLVGMESLGMRSYVCDVAALESSEIWELPYRLLVSACLLHPELQLRLSAALAGEIRRHRVWALALATLSATQRVAVFLLDFAARCQARGYSGSCFILRMSRKEIASYLVLQHETLSRVLRHLADTRCIAVERSEVRILDPGAMAMLAGRAGTLN